MTAPSFYCFPELDAGDGRGASAAERGGAGFQRVAPGLTSAGAGLPAGGGSAPGRATVRRRVPVEAVEQAAYCRGFSDGERSGHAQGEQAGGDAVRREVESVLQSLGRMLEELESLRQKDAREFEKELVEMVLAVARKVVGQEVAANPDAVAHLLRDALGRIEHAGPLTIRMNPADLERLSDLRPQLLEGLADPGRVRFEADEGLGAGGCLIESGAGDIDARVEQRFRVVADALRAEARRHAGAQRPRG
jgi:flagellar assembly protein FliH